MASFAGYCSRLRDPLPDLLHCLCVRFSAVSLVGLLSGIFAGGTTLCAAFTISSVIWLLYCHLSKFPAVHELPLSV